MQDKLLFRNIFGDVLKILFEFSCYFNCSEQWATQNHVIVKLEKILCVIWRHKIRNSYARSRQIAGICDDNQGLKKVFNDSRFEFLIDEKKNL